MLFTTDSSYILSHHFPYPMVDTDKSMDTDICQPSCHSISAAISSIRYAISAAETIYPSMLRLSVNSDP